MAIISDKKLAQYAAQAGFRGPQLVMSVAVAIAENRSKDTNATNRNTDGSTDTGLWQINSVHGIGNLKNPTVNANAAFKISKGGTDWSPWVTYDRGLHKAHIPRAKRAVAAMGGGSLSESDIFDAGTEGPLEATVNQVFDFGKFFDYITDGAVWARAAFVLIGIILLVIGAGLIATDIGLSSQTFNKVAKVIPG